MHEELFVLSRRILVLLCASFLYRNKVGFASQPTYLKVLDNLLTLLALSLNWGSNLFMIDGLQDTL